MTTTTTTIMMTMTMKNKIATVSASNVQILFFLFLFLFFFLRLLRWIDTALAIQPLALVVHAALVFAALGVLAVVAVMVCYASNQSHLNNWRNPLTNLLEDINDGPGPERCANDDNDNDDDDAIGTGVGIRK